MDRDSIIEFLKELTDNQHLKTKKQGQWHMCSCPLAPWLHMKGSDRNFSFGIKVNEDDTSVFNCWGCKKKGPLSHLVYLYSHYTGEDLTDLAEAVEHEDFISGHLPEWEDAGKRKNVETLGEPLGVEFEDLYEPAVGHWYLKERGVPDDIAEQLGLGIDPRDAKGDSRIVFPVRSYSGELHGYTGRAFNDNPKLRVKDYFGLKKSCLLLGAEWIDPAKDKYVVLVEGLFDFVRLFMYGYPVVAAMHAGITEQQAEILKDIGLPVYAFQDRDKGGEEGKRVIKDLLGDYLPLMKVKYPDRYVEDEDGTERLVKDPDELFEEEVEWMLDNPRIL